MQSELERHTARLVAARKALAEVSQSLTASELLREIGHAHARVEAAERRLASAWWPRLAIWSRKRLVAAEAAEKELLAAHGYDSWFGLQLAQVDTLLDPPSPEAVATAELEHQLALAACEALAGGGEPVAEDAAGTGLVSLPGLLRPDGLRPAVA